MAKPAKVHNIGDPIMVHAEMTEAERDELRGVKVHYEVIRDGRSVTRAGSIGRIDNRFIWISGWVYFVAGEVRNLRRA